MSDEPILIADVRRLDVRPGDTILLTVYRDDVSAEQLADIRTTWEAQFPDAKAIVFAPGFSVTVVREHDA